MSVRSIDAMRIGTGREQGKPRLVHVITRLIVGGAQLTAIRLCDLLSDTYDTYLLTGPQIGVEGSLHEMARAATNVTIVPGLCREVDVRKDVGAVREVRHLIAQIDPAIVHTHSSKAGIVGRTAAVRGNARVVHTVHGWGHTPGDPLLRRAMFVGLERLAARHTDALIAVSEDVRAEGLRRRIGTSDQYHVIPGLVDLEPRSPDFALARRRARNALGIDEHVPIVGWVGRFAAQKDPETLIAAMAAVLHEHREARAVLVGDGTMRQSVERGLADPGIASRVLFTGVRHDARDLYAAFDVLMHPTLWEGQPLVIQEALAERIPVVSARVNGTQALIQDGVNGYLVDPGDHPAFSRRILEVLHGGGPSSPLPAEATERFAALAGEERSLTKHRDLYASLISSR